ncbi:MAG: hypothetical protein AAF828_10825 [Bacteroidota bacterium]
MHKWLYLLIAILLLPALLINLGEVVFIDDEGIRATVAQEMIWTGNYIAPTLHGDAYLNKPPLWNWILATSFLLFGETTEFTARFPTVIALLGFAATAFFFSRKLLGKELALIHALTVITCGRMLFWDSMLALIDVCFSWVVYTQIMLLYYYGREQKWWRTFGWVYLLCAVGFMLKGLPAIAFTGISIITFLVWQRKFWQLFYPPHLLCGLACLGLLGLYYWAYSDYLDLSLVAQRLFNESGKRTAVNYAWQETVGHFFAFPFEMSYHFLPWTFLLLFFFQRGSWRLLRTNPAATFMLIVFLTNLPLYWLSPNVYPRYLLMLFPLLFGSGLVLWQDHARRNTRSYRGFMYLLAGLMSLAALGFFAIPLVPKTAVVAYRWPIAITSGLLGLTLAGYTWRLLGLMNQGSKRKTSQVQAPPPTAPPAGELEQPTHQDDGPQPSEARDRLATGLPSGANASQRLRTPGFTGTKSSVPYTLLLTFCAFLLLLRIVFNVFILPPRAIDDIRGERVRASAYQLIQAAQEQQQDLAIFGYTLMEPASSFYLQQAYGKIIPRQFTAFNASRAYLVNPWQYESITGTTFGRLYMRHQQLEYDCLFLAQPAALTVPPPPELADGMGTGLPLHP